MGGEYDRSVCVFSTWLNCKIMICGVLVIARADEIWLKHDLNHFVGWIM